MRQRILIHQSTENIQASVHWQCCVSSVPSRHQRYADESAGSRAGVCVSKSEALVNTPAELLGMLCHPLTVTTGTSLTTTTSWKVSPGSSDHYASDAEAEMHSLGLCSTI